MQRSFRPLFLAPIGLACLARSRFRSDVARSCDGLGRVLAFAATVNGACACQNPPFTSCVDDATPCEVSEVAEGTESSASTVVGGSLESSPTSPTIGPGTGSAPTSVNNSLASSNSAALEEDARVASPSEEDASVASSTLDASVETTSTQAPSLTNDDNSFVSAPFDAGITSEPAVASSSEETSTVVVPTGDSVITNGDFASGMTSWKIEQTGGRSPLMTQDDGVLCVQSQGNVDFTLGWPANAGESANLPRGRYQLSFRAQGVGAEMDVKVGHAYEPYDALHEVAWSSSTDDWDQHVSAFMTRGDDATGLAFFVRLTGGSLCIDDVLLSPILDAAPMD